MLLGIDGGQSSTVAVLAREDGCILARVVGPPADLVGRAPGSRRRADVLETIAADALVRAALPASTDFAAVVAGISGFEPGDDRDPPPHLRTARLTLVHDAEIAHAGAFAGGDGIVVIAGTGSVALGVSAHVRVRAGGWGYLFGDGGSAFAIARGAVSRAMEAQDRGRATALAAAALEATDTASLRAVQSAFARGELTRPRLAAFARTVLQLADAGDPEAHAVAAEAARALASLVGIVDERLPGSRRPVAMLGGVFASAGFRARFEAECSRVVPHAEVMSPRYDAALGALVLAFREAGMPQPVAFTDSTP